MVLMAAFLTQVGALQTAPVLSAVVTAFLSMNGVKYLLTSRRQARAAVPKQANPGLMLAGSGISQVRPQTAQDITRRSHSSPATTQRRGRRRGLTRPG